jgi:hypothetical protein
MTVWDESNTAESSVFNGWGLRIKPAKAQKPEEGK